MKLLTETLLWAFLSSSSLMKHLLFALLLLLWNVVTGEELLQQVLLRDAPSCDRKYMLWVE